MGLRAYLAECYDKSMWEGEGVKCYNKTLWEGEVVLLLLNFEHKHVLLVVLSMAADVPQLHVEYVGRGDLGVAARAILLAHELDEGVVKTSAHGGEEGGTG